MLHPGADFKFMGQQWCVMLSITFAEQKKESPESSQTDEAENFIDRSSINHVRD